MQFDYSLFIQGKTSHVVFLWKYIYYIYYFYANLTKYGQLSWPGKRLAEGIRLLFLPPHGSGLSCCSWVLDEKKKKREILSKKMKEKVLSVSLLPPFSHSSPSCLLCLLAHVTCLLADLASLAPKLKSDPAVPWPSAHSQTPGTPI